jgi:hypothetical protein
MQAYLHHGVSACSLRHATCTSPRANRTSFEKVDDWQGLAIVDGRLITGQNPSSSLLGALH